jgi:predicted acyltransferase
VFPIATAYNADGVSDFDHFLGIAMRVGFVAAALASVVLLAGTKRVWLWVPVLILGLALFFPGAFKFGRSDVIIDRLAEIRYPGVLVRIGFCYLLASAIYFVTPRPKALVAWIVALLAIYWIWMVYIPIPGFGRPDLERSFPTLETPRDELFSNWCFYIDHHVFGPHVYRKLWLEEEVVGNPEAEPIRTLIWSFDPEGLLSSMSAICSILLGILTGMWLTREDKTPGEKTTGMFSAGCWLLVIGLVMSIWFPINKRIWTSSYTVFMAGMALLFLSMCYHTIDVKGHRRWCAPFVWYGMNAITAFVLSGMMASSMGRIRIGESNTLKGWLMEQVFNPAFGAHTKDASLAFAVSFVTLWALLMGVLHWRKIYLKV